jgi:HlyD family secretion protein
MKMHLKLTKKYVIGGVVILAVAALVAFLARPKPLVVETATVRRQPLETAIDADGHTRVKDRFAVVAPVAGRLMRTTLVEGKLVRAGDVVARIAPLPLDPAAVEQARARLDAASASVIVATGQQRVAELELDQRRRELSRAQRLAAVGGVAPQIVEESQVALAEAEQAANAATQRVTTAEADVRQARATLAGDPRTTGAVVLVRAPAGGRVLRITDRSERIVAPGTSIVEIGDPGALEVVVDVLSSDAATISPGDVVRMTGWITSGTEGDGITMTGHVREIEPAAFTKLSALGVEEQRVNVIVDVANPPAQMGDGYRVDARIVVWSERDVLSVPTSALVRGTADAAQGWVTYAVRNGRIERRQVRLGQSGGGAAEVISGLEAGDAVVVFPSDKVQAGLRVTPRPASAQ